MAANLTSRDSYDYRRAAWMPSTSRQETYDRMLDLVRAGCRTRNQLAEALGGSFHAVRCYMWRQGITMTELLGREPRQKRAKSPRALADAQRRARARELHERGWTIARIARELRCRKNTAAALCRAAGCTILKPGEHNSPSRIDPPIGALPPGHRLRPVDEAALRDRAMLAMADARRALMRMQAL